MRPRDVGSETPGAIFGTWKVVGPADFRGGGRALKCVCLMCGRGRTIGKTYLKTTKVRCWDCKQSARVKACADPAVLDGGPWAILRDRAKRGADNRKIPFNLTRAELKHLYDEQHGRCALSGVELSVLKPVTASLDRIDSRGWYNVGNVQWVHKNVNIAKHTLSNEEFIGMCLAVAQNYLGKPVS